MRLTTARYYTPSGRSIQAKGIDPDIVVEPAKIEKIATGDTRHEADLKGALKNTDPTAATPAAAPGDKPANGANPPADDSEDTNAFGGTNDYQLARAVDMLRGISLFGANKGPSAASATQPAKANPIQKQ
jgi:carboxyl-terminal processing protease